MLRWGIVFLVLAAVAWLLGFYALAGAAAFAARIVLAFFLVSAVVFLMLAAASTRAIGD